ncbi:hypothetical protein [Actinoplanes sp. NBRC 103695]|uniref:hypothetical protein n=1 Tax=Actinoplanes sp. NBRC 103695 TaxID=3032202 RepID=UPI0024A328D5|nr:hypothetical protein [Actinoplanes sp. NBRC 103695]GLY93559.1 hypothetical protein Acsp02_08150 [Actinoplanes sp. NBRC 103695]
MPELDELLREAAYGAAAQTRGGDFDAVERGARRRRARLAGAGAAGLVAAIAVGAVVLAGLPGGPAPVPGAGVQAAASASASADLTPGALETDVPVLSWSFENGASSEEILRELLNKPQAYVEVIGGGRLNLRNYFPDTPAGDYLVLGGLRQPPTRSRAEQFVAEMAERPGVRRAELITVRGYWFGVTATVVRSTPLPQKEIMAPRFKPGTGMTGSSWMSTELGDGKFRWTANYTFLRPTMSDADLQDMRADAERHWGADTVATFTPRAMPPG